jgi:hypothetical protein
MFADLDPSSNRLSRARSAAAPAADPQAGRGVKISISPTLGGAAQVGRVPERARLTWPGLSASFERLQTDQNTAPDILTQDTTASFLLSAAEPQPDAGPAAEESYLSCC